MKVKIERWGGLLHFLLKNHDINEQTQTWEQVWSAMMMQKVLQQVDLIASPLKYLRIHVWCKLLYLFHNEWIDPLLKYKINYSISIL